MHVKLFKKSLFGGEVCQNDYIELEGRAKSMRYNMGEGYAKMITISPQKLHYLWSVSTKTRRTHNYNRRMSNTYVYLYYEHHYLHYHQLMIIMMIPLPWQGCTGWKLATWGQSVWSGCGIPGETRMSGKVLFRNTDRNEGVLKPYPVLFWTYPA